MRKWLALVLAGSVLTAGCMGGGSSGGGQGPQAQPEPSSEQVTKAVKSTLATDEMKDFLRTQVRAQAGTEMMQLALDTQQGQSTVHDAVKRSLTSSVGQQAIINNLSVLMNDPLFKTQMQQAIKDALNEMLAKGTKAGTTGQAKDQGGKQSGGGGATGGGGGTTGGGGGGGGGGA